MRIFTPLECTRIFFAIVTILFFAVVPVYSQRWEKVILDEPYGSNYWLDIYFLPTNPQLGWICGDKSMVLRTIDGGLTWQGTKADNIKNARLESIHFPTQSVGYTSGSENIYRTANGGATWQEVTPASGGAIWGCYFVNADTGMVIGSGCGNYQLFYRTTNGGSSWTLARDSVTNSGLTDLILNPVTGLGYAVSSGWIWQTLDHGITWQTFMPTGTKTWHEEITHHRSSFLLPTAGTTCSGTGDGDGGGMRFSTNDGVDWTNYGTPEHNYGAFLLNDSTGWVCGLKSQIYYTSNYGQTWDLRNCGISGDLDDTHFIDDTTGWVVGDKGVYRLSAPFRSINKSSLNYGEACYPGVKNDTVYVKISSFFQVFGTIQLTGDNPDEFKILEPGASFIAPACDSMRIVIQFQPTSDGEKTANAIIRFTNPSTELTLQLVGKTKRVASLTRTDTLTFKSAPCGFTSIDSLVFNNPGADSERVVSVERITEDNPLMLISQLPLKLPPNDSNSLFFQVVPTDTGWITTHHLVWIGVCSKLVTVNAYGTSPIINAPATRTMLLNCSTYMLDTIYITNTGNKPLDIPSLRITGADSSDYKIVGYTNGASLPLSIAPQKNLGVIIRFGPVAAGQQKNAVLRIENNDSTLTRGRMSPYYVTLTGLLGSSIVSVSDTVINCGEICVNSSKQFKFKVKNIGTAPAKINSFSNTERTFSFSASVGTEIRQVDSVTITVFAAPEHEGTIDDTLRFTLEPCGEKFVVALKCKGVKTSLESTPVEIRETIASNRIVKRSIAVKSTGSAPVIISSISLTPIRPDWKLIDFPTLPDTLDVGEQMQVNVEFSATNDTLFNGKVCFNATQICPVQICVPIQVQSITSRLGFSVSELDFGDSHCVLPNSRKTFTVKNDGTVNDTVKVVLINGSPIFTLITPTVGSLELAPGNTGTVEVEYKPTAEGTHPGELSIWSVKQDTVRFSVPLRGSFAKTNTSMTSSISSKTLEPCNNPVHDTVIFQNTGTLTDTLTISIDIPLSGFSITPNDRVILLPGSAQNVIITTTPAAFPTLKDYSQLCTFQGNCSGKFDVPVTCSIIRPKLTITPSSINLDRVSQGDTITKIITITNPTSSPKSITGIDFNNGTSDFSIEPPSLPDTIDSGGTLLLTVKFIADSVGSSTGRLRIIEQSGCMDTTAIDMQADVFRDHFVSTVKINDYSVKYGDVLTIPVFLEQSVSGAGIEKITSEIEFDSKLMAILNVTHSGDTLPFTRTDGKLLVVRIATPDKVLGDTGEVFTIKALALLSSPDTTTLHISQFTVVARKELEIAKKDGFLRIDDGCHIAVGLRQQPVLTTSIVSPVPIRDNISLEMKSTDEQTANIILSDMMGESRYTSTTLITQVPKQLSISTTELPSGMYFISVNSMGKTFRQKIVLVK